MNIMQKKTTNRYLHWTLPYSQLLGSFYLSWSLATSDIFKRRSEEFDGRNKRFAPEIQEFGRLLFD